MNVKGVGLSGVGEIEGGGMCLYTKELFFGGDVGDVGRIP